MEEGHKKSEGAPSTDWKPALKPKMLMMMMTGAEIDFLLELFREFKA